VGSSYAHTLEAADGAEPYTWQLADGQLPNGLALEASGALTGTPEQIGTWTFDVKVSDSASNTAEEKFSLNILGEGLRIITESPLPEGEEGFEYTVNLEATGGITPYGWMISEGSLPAGLNLYSDGTIIGTPSEIGEFPFTAKVFDNLAPPNLDAKDFLLKIKVAPLEIYGDKEYNLFITKLIVLKTLFVIGSTPVPYNTQLTARGGLRPHFWAETDPPAALLYLIPTFGIPDGLTLSPSGELSGTVTDPTSVSEITIPVINITLKGFFFMAKVEDSQSTPDSDTALFIIPTLP